MSAASGEHPGPPLGSDPQVIGSYRVVQRIGAGGMAVVYEALQQRPQRRVAIKMLHARLNESMAHRRFMLESQLLGGLSHPGIAAVYEIGTHEVGGEQVPYIVMEFITDARSITAHANGRNLDRDQRIGLFVQVCEAIQHGHQHGVIHRDLKPENILVDAAGRAKVIDYGVARVFSSELDRQVSSTGIGQVIGTMSYMSPEQMSGDSRDLDTRADIYALGAVLYELLCGRPPHDLVGCDYFEAVQRVTKQAPTRLSSLDPQFSGDLETVVEKTLAREKEHRYATVAELAGDLRRVLGNLPISARPQTLVSYLKLVTHRHKGVVSGVVTALVAIVVGVVLAIGQTSRATAALNEARVRSEISDRLAYRMSIATASAALAAHDVARARLSLRDVPETLREWEWHHLSSRLDFSIAQIHLGSEHRNGNAWPVPGPQRAVIVQSSEGVESFSLDTPQTPDLIAAPGTLYARSLNGQVQVLVKDQGIVLEGGPAQQRREIALREWGIPAENVIRAVELSADGDILVLADEADVWCIELHAGRVHHRIISRQGTLVLGMACARGPVVCLAAGVGGRATIWNVATDEATVVAGAGRFARSAAISPDGQHAVFGLHDTTIGVWDIASGRKLATGRGHIHAVTTVAYSPDGRMIASASLDRTVRLWDAMTLQSRAILHGHETGVWHARFSADGSVLTTIGENGAVRLWDATRMTPPGVMEGHTSYVYPVAFSQDGKLIASGSWDNTVRVWDVASRQEVRLLQRAALPSSVHRDRNSVIAVSFSASGARLVSMMRDSLDVWDVESGRMLAGFTPQTGSDWLHIDSAGRLVVPLMFSADEHSIPLPWTIRGRQVTVWDIASGQVQQRDLGVFSGIRHEHISVDSNWLVTPNVDSPAGHPRSKAMPRAPLAVVNLETGQRAAVPDITCPMMFSRTESTPTVLAAVLRYDSEIVVLIDVESGRELGRLGRHTGPVYGIAWSADSRRIATSCSDQTIRLWDAATGEEVVQLLGHRAYVWSVAFSPDGSQLLSGSGDHTVRLWSTASRLIE